MSEHHRQQLFIVGTMHAATTTISRLICDVDPNCLYFFEPDFGGFCNTSVGIERYLSFVQCRPGDAFCTGQTQGWEALKALPWKEELKHYQLCKDVTMHCSAGLTLCAGDDCNRLQHQCDSSPWTGMKSILMDGRLSEMIDALVLAPSMTIVHLVRDVRGVLATWIIHDFLPTIATWSDTHDRDKYKKVANWFRPLDTREERTQVLREATRARMREKCPRLQADHVAAVQHLHAGSGHGQYLLVNVESFLGTNDTDAAAVVLSDRVRDVIGMPPLREIPDRRFPVKGLTRVSWWNSTMPSRTTRRWEWVLQYLPDYETIVAEECDRTLFYFDADWVLKHTIAGTGAPSPSPPSPSPPSPSPSPPSPSPRVGELVLASDPSSSWRNTTLTALYCLMLGILLGLFVVCVKLLSQPRTQALTVATRRLEAATSSTACHPAPRLGGRPGPKIVRPGPKIVRRSGQTGEQIQMGLMVDRVPFSRLQPADPD
uniref:Uncharacterized protein n=1 Tax=Haptolina ericina TaxID=156174 RepID=A0A7S3ASA4_9EUKA